MNRRLIDVARSQRRSDSGNRRLANFSVKRAVIERNRGMRVGIGDNFDQPGPLGRECRVKGRAEITGPGDGRCPATTGTCDRCMINRRKVAGCGVGAKLHGLGIFLITQNAVVEYDRDNGHAAANHGFKLGPTVGEAAVSHHGYRRAIRIGEFGSYSVR